MVGFKRRRKIEEIEDRGDSQHEGSAIGDECNQRILIKYIWRGKNAVLINSELESAEARLT